MWKVYNWLWHRAQKSAVREIVSLMQAWYPQPDELRRKSKSPNDQRYYFIANEQHIKAMQFAEFLLEEFEVNRRPKKVDLLRNKEDIANFDDELENR